MKIGYVSETNRQSGLVRVNIGGKNTGELPVIQNGTGWFPEINDMVVCLFLENGEGDGVVLGGIKTWGR